MIAGANDGQGGEELRERYYELFADSAEADWRGLAEKDPGARGDLEFLETMSRLRRAYQDSRDARRRGRSPPAEPRNAVNLGGPLAVPLRGETVRLSRGGAVAAYQILERVGEGSFARVYRARDLKMERPVALKILKSPALASSQILSRFRREARALASFRHENIAQVYHVIDEPNVVGLCMEYIEGKNLSQILEVEGPLAPREVASVGIDLCRALAEVHRRGLVHRDLKAENVMRERGGRIVLMDFGMTRSLDPGGPRETATGVLVGTPVAMAPEQYEFKAIDERTDIYALGALLYRLASARYAVLADSMPEMRRRVLEGDYPRLRDVSPDVPEALAAAIEKAMHREPARRFRSMGEFEAALLACRDGGGGAAPRTGTRSGGGQPSGLLVGLLGGILVTLVAILALLVYLSVRR